MMNKKMTKGIQENNFINVDFMENDNIAYLLIRHNNAVEIAKRLT